MIRGEIYDPSDNSLSQMRANARSITAKYNQTNPDQKVERSELLKALFGQTFKGIKIEPSFNGDYGKNIKVGENFYVNYGCVILDCAEVNIGDNCMIGPQVGIYTACHPLDPIERNSGVEFAKPITIGDNCCV